MKHRNKSSSVRQDLLERKSQIQLIQTERNHSHSIPNLQDFVQKQSHSYIGVSESKHTSNFPTSQYDLNYNTLDLTYTLIFLNLYHHIVMVVIFTILVIIRYYLTLYLIYLWFVSDHLSWQWLCILGVSRVLFLIIVMKISLRSSQTNTQIILKTHWNSKYNVVQEYFEVFDWKMFVPAQFAFIYLKCPPKKKIKIYACINYIYASIQFVFFYPFIIVYLLILIYYSSIEIAYESIALAIFGWLLILSISLMLLFYGTKQKNKYE